MPNNLDNQELENQTEQATEPETIETTDTVETKESSDTAETKSDRALEREKRRADRQAAEKSDFDFKQKYENLAKEHQNFRSLADRQLNELRASQLSPDDRKLIKEIQDLKRKSELEGLKKSNPDEYQKRVTDDLITERLKAQQSNQTQSDQTSYNQSTTFTPEQFNQMGNYAADYLARDPEIGPEKYKVMEPVMVDVLHSVEDPQDRAKLLQNPRVLFNMAVGQAYMNALAQQSKTSAAGISKANSFHEGTAKSVSTGKRSIDYNSLSDKELEKLKNEELLKQHSN